MQFYLSFLFDYVEEERINVAIDAIFVLIVDKIENESQR